MNASDIENRVNAEFENAYREINIYYSGLDTKKIVKWLHQASHFRDKVIPEGIEIQTSSHDTATHAYVYLTMEGHKSLLVWYCTNWISPRYDSNERGKIHGFQPGCDFARPIIEPVFVEIREKLKAHSAKVINQQRYERITELMEKEALKDIYRKEFTT